MTIEAISFIFGILLIGTSLLGGGFQAREINVPKIGNTGRIVCAVLGGAFIVLGIVLNPAPKSANSAESTTNPKEGDNWIGFQVINRLGEKQVSEQVRVVIDGQVKGTITVSELHPQADLLVSIPRAGRYHYQLIVSTVFMGKNNELVDVDGAGEGYINVTNGAIYELEGNMSGGIWRVALIQR